jgi:helix-turn-helix protein
MPWKATDVMKERTKFVLEWERRWNEAEGGLVNMAELCRMFGVSRQTGYTWVERYLAERTVGRAGGPDRGRAQVLPALGTAQAAR